MPAPYDYTIGEVASPQQSFLQGIQMVDALRKREQDQAAAIEAKRKEQELQALYAEALKPDAKPDVFERLSFAIDPQKAAFTKFQQRSDAQQAATRQNVFNVWTPLLTGNKELSLAEVDKQLAAMQNSGSPAESIQALKAIRQSIETNPELAQVSLASSLSGMGEQGKSMVTSAWDALKKPQEQKKAAGEAAKFESEAAKAKIEADFAERLQQAGLNEKNWNTKNLQSQINDRSQRLALERTKVNAEIAEKMANIGAKLTELPESAQKLVNEAAVTAAASKQDAARMNDLAKQLESLDGGWGKFTSLQEWTKSQYGGQDLRSALLGEYTRLANSSGIKAYKASGATGGFSDTDLKTALAGIPPSNSSPQQLASFMRGMAKMQDMDAALNNAKTDWLTQNKGQLGRARTGFMAGDYSVNQGETYADFSARVSADIAKRYAPKEPRLSTTPAQPSNYKNMSDTELMKLLGR